MAPFEGMEAYLSRGFFTSSPVTRPQANATPDTMSLSQKLAALDPIFADPDAVQIPSLTQAVPQPPLQAQPQAQLRQPTISPALNGKHVVIKEWHKDRYVELESGKCDGPIMIWNKKPTGEPGLFKTSLDGIIVENNMLYAFYGRNAFDHGKARAAKLTPERRKAIAEEGARAARKIDEDKLLNGATTNEATKVDAAKVLMNEVLK